MGKRDLIEVSIILMNFMCTTRSILLVNETTIQQLVSTELIKADCTTRSYYIAVVIDTKVLRKGQFSLLNAKRWVKGDNWYCFKRFWYDATILSCSYDIV